MEIHEKKFCEVTEEAQVQGQVHLSAGTVLQISRGSVHTCSDFLKWEFRAIINSSLKIENQTFARRPYFADKCDVEIGVADKSLHIQS